MSLSSWCKGKSSLLLNSVQTRLVLYIILIISYTFFNSKFAILYGYTYLTVIILTTLFVWFTNRMLSTNKILTNRLARIMSIILYIALLSLKIILFKSCYTTLFYGYNIFNLSGYDYVYRYGIQNILLVLTIVQFAYSLLCNLHYLIRYAFRKA